MSLILVKYLWKYEFHLWALGQFCILAGDMIQYIDIDASNIDSFGFFTFVKYQYVRTYEGLKKRYKVKEPFEKGASYTTVNL